MLTPIWLIDAIGTKIVANLMLSYLGISFLFYFEDLWDLIVFLIMSWFSFLIWCNLGANLKALKKILWTWMIDD